MTDFDVEGSPKDRGPETNSPADGPSRVWVVDPDADGREALVRRAQSLGHEVVEFDSPIALLHGYAGEYGCVLIAEKFGDEGTMHLLRAFVQRGWTTPVIVLTTDLEPAWIVRVMRAGAFSVLERAASTRRLATTIEDAILEDESRRRQDQLRLALRRRIDALAPGELDVLRLLVLGNSNKVIARRLDVSERTVENRRRSVYEKFAVQSLAQLVAAACEARDPRVPTISLAALLEGGDPNADASD